MSMSLVVKGFVPPDEKWQRMKRIWDECNAAGVAVPEEVEKFFDWQAPDPAGIEKKLTVTEWRTDFADGYELAVADIPAHVKTIRFYASY